MGPLFVASSSFWVCQRKLGRSYPKSWSSDRQSYPHNLARGLRSHQLQGKEVQCTTSHDWHICADPQPHLQILFESDKSFTDRITSRPDMINGYCFQMLSGRHFRFSRRMPPLAMFTNHIAERNIPPSSMIARGSTGKPQNSVSVGHGVLLLGHASNLI